MQFEALSQLDDNLQRSDEFDRIVRAGPWKLATFDGLLARRPMPFAAVLVHDAGKALELAVERIEQEGQELTVIAYSAEVQPERVVDAMHSGAIDYLQWPLSNLKLADRLTLSAHRAARRTRKVGPGRALLERFDTLSIREREVLQSMTRGNTNKDIARLLGISPRTVEIHRANMLGKIEASNALEAVVLAVKADLFSGSTD